MINIYLCEDDKKQLNIWIKVIEDYLQMHHLNERLVFSTQSPGNLLQELNIHPCLMGLYFLDICLNSDMNGLQLASEIRKKDPLGEIVFITSRSEMCYLTYEYQVGALDFIIKDNITELPLKIKKCMHTASEKEMQIAALTAEPLYLKVNGERTCFNPNDIIYIETNKDSIHRITINTATGLESTYGTLKEMEATLEKYSYFCRCHKSIIVNQKYIKKIHTKSKEILLSTGVVIPVSSRYLHEMRNDINIKNYK